MQLQANEIGTAHNHGFWIRRFPYKGHEYFFLLVKYFLNFFVHHKTSTIFASIIFKVVYMLLLA